MRTNFFRDLDSNSEANWLLPEPGIPTRININGRPSAIDVVYVQRESLWRTAGAGGAVCCVLLLLNVAKILDFSQIGDTGYISVVRNIAKFKEIQDLACWLVLVTPYQGLPC